MLAASVFAKKKKPNAAIRDAEAALQVWPSYHFIILYGSAEEIKIDLVKIDKQFCIWWLRFFFLSLSFSPALPLRSTLTLQKGIKYEEWQGPCWVFG